MRAFRSVVSVLVSLVRSFSTNSRPALRAAACGGRPRPPQQWAGNLVVGWMSILHFNNSCAGNRQCSGAGQPQRFSVA